MRDFIQKCARALGGFWARRGYAVLVCVCVLTLGYGAYSLKTRPRDALARPAPTPAQALLPLSETGADIAPISPAPVLAWPVGGRAILTGHAPDRAQWSEALGQYRAHTGVDIAAGLGEVVVAAADGTVAQSYYDTQMGYTVELRHENGLTTLYQNLAGTQLAQVGRYVRKNEAIGAVGASAIAEPGSHLHFEAWRDGEYVALTE